MTNQGDQIDQKIMEWLKRKLETGLKERGIDIPICVVDTSKEEWVADELIKRPDYKDKFTRDELFAELVTLKDRNLSNPPKDEDELKQRAIEFISFLKEEKEYEATIFISGIYELPVGLKIGLMEIISEGSEVDELKKYIETIQKYGLSFNENGAWARIKIKSYKSYLHVKDDVYKQLELPFSILSLVTNIDLDPANIIGFVYPLDKKGRLYLAPFKGTGWSKYHSERYNKYIEIISKIIQKYQPTKLEKKIIQSIHLFSLSRLSHKNEIRFLMILSAFESLLLTKSDRDYLGFKLAEKTTFLLESECKKREILYNLMKKFYRLRSDLIHGGNVTIDESTEAHAKEIFKAVVLRLLDLTSKYEKMERKTNEKDTMGVEDYIDEMKFT